MSAMIERLRPVLLRVLRDCSEYVHDLDAEGAAIAAENGETYAGNQGVIVDGVIDPEKVLRSLIEAMREPTEAMLAAAKPTEPPWYGETRYLAPADIWEAMIDAALAEPLSEAATAPDCTHPSCPLKLGQCQTAGGRTEHFTDCPALVASAKA